MVKLTTVTTVRCKHIILPHWKENNRFKTVMIYFNHFITLIDYQTDFGTGFGPQFLSGQGK